MGRVKEQLLNDVFNTMEDENATTRIEEQEEDERTAKIMCLIDELKEGKDDERIEALYKLIG